MSIRVLYIIDYLGPGEAQVLVRNLFKGTSDKEIESLAGKVQLSSIRTTKIGFQEVKQES